MKKENNYHQEKHKYLANNTAKHKKISRYWVLSLLLVIVILLGAKFYYNTKNWNKNTMFVPPETVEDTTKYITVNGSQYYLNEDIISVLLLGLDLSLIHI